MSTRGAPDGRAQAAVGAAVTPAPPEATGAAPGQAAGAADLDSPASWRVLAGCGVIFVFSVPALFGSTFGLFMVPLEKAFGWSRGAIAFSLTLTIAISWVSVLVAGWLADHVRLKPLLAVGIVLGAANLAAFAAMAGEITFFYGLVVALAFTSLGASPLILSKTVQGWFDRRLGAALGILFACASVGAVLHPLTVTAVMTLAGWREAFLAMGAMALAGGLLARWLLVRERPAAARAVAAAQASPTHAAQAAMAPAAGETGANAIAPMLALLGQRLWWAMGLWNLLFAFGSGCIMVHFAALLHDRGVPMGQIGVVASLIGASMFAGNLLAGWLADRVDPRRMAYLLMLMPLAATLLLWLGHGMAVMVLAALVLGLSGGSDGSLSHFLVRHYWGSALYGQASGTQMVITALGGGTAPWISGLLRDASGNYQLSLMVAAGCFAAAVVAGWCMPKADRADPAGPASPAAPAGTRRGAAMPAA
ncbi:MAG: MFS transporter [Rubrivivax sp.]|nr:MFS transporter [Rubrivivax sp.]